MHRAELQRALLASLAPGTVLTGAHVQQVKIGAASPFTVLPLTAVSGIITDAPTDHPVLQELEAAGTTIISAR